MFRAEGNNVWTCSTCQWAHQDSGHKPSIQRRRDEPFAVFCPARMLRPPIKTNQRLVGFFHRKRWTTVPFGPLADILLGSDYLSCEHLAFPPETSPWHPGADGPFVRGLSAPTAPESEVLCLLYRKSAVYLSSMMSP